MKKLFYLLTALTLVFIIGCNKNDDLQMGNELSSNRQLQLRTDNNLRIYYDHGGKDYGCHKTGGNCLPDIVITADKIQRMDQIFDTVDDGDVDDIITIFTEEYDLLTESVDESTIDSVINGEYTVESKGFNSENIRYLLFYSNQNSIKVLELVAPFK